MASNILAQSILFFVDLQGNALDQGYLYFGVANGNPETTPITVYWDAAATIPAAQPIRTINGYPVYNGRPSPIFATVDYSITARDKNSNLITTYTYTAASGISSPPPAVSGATVFTGLLDTFTYAGKALKPLRVNAAETALETYTPSAAANTFLALTDVNPKSYSGLAGQSLIVNSTETGVTFDGLVLGDASYRLLADQSLTAATTTTIAFALSNYDSLKRGTFSTVTNLYTAGASGARILISVHCLALSMNAGEIFEIFAEKNTATRVGYDKEINELTAATQPYTTQIVKCLSLAAGETVRIRGIISATRSISSALENSWFDIVELG